jgi:hypothetical protein
VKTTGRKGICLVEQSTRALGITPACPDVKFEDVQENSGYVITPDIYIRPRIQGSFVGTAAGCVFFIHDRATPRETLGIIFTRIHVLNAIPDDFEQSIDLTELRSGVVLSAWTFVGDYSVPALQKGWWQVPFSSKSEGAASWSCPGSQNGTTIVSVTISRLL